MMPRCRRVDSPVGRVLCLNSPVGNTGVAECATVQEASNMTCGISEERHIGSFPQSFQHSLLHLSNTQLSPWTGYLTSRPLVLKAINIVAAMSSLTQCFQKLNNHFEFTAVVLPKFRDFEESLLAFHENSKKVSMAAEKDCISKAITLRNCSHIEVPFIFLIVSMLIGIYRVWSNARKAKAYLQTIDKQKLAIDKLTNQLSAAKRELSEERNRNEMIDDLISRAGVLCDSIKGEQASEGHGAVLQTPSESEHGEI
jgi:hypothetical protein